MKKVVRIVIYGIAIIFILMGAVSVVEMLGFFPANPAHVRYHTTDYGLRYVTFARKELPGELRTIWVDSEITEVEELQPPLPEGYSLFIPPGKCEWITVGTTALTQYHEKISRHQETIKFCGN